MKAKVVCICDGSKAGRKKGITSDLPAGAVLTEVFCPQIVCTCCSLCPNAAPVVFLRPVSASSLGLRLNTATPGSLSLSAGGSPTWSASGKGVHVWGEACLAWGPAVHLGFLAPAPGRPPTQAHGLWGMRWYLALGCLHPSAELSDKWGRKEGGSDSRPNRASLPYPPPHARPQVSYSRLAPRPKSLGTKGGNTGRF